MYLVDGEPASNVVRLTDRDRDVLLALARTAGTDRQVAEEVGLKTGSMKTYLVRIRQKLAAQGFDVKSRYKLITWAKEHQKELEEK